MVEPAKLTGVLEDLKELLVCVQGLGQDSTVNVSLSSGIVCEIRMCRLRSCT